MNDAGFPPIPPPPPLPPAPVGYEPVSVIRWGMGDVFWGLLLYVLGGLVASVVLVATGAIDLNAVADTGKTGELSVAAVAVTVAAGWLGFVGWPIVVTYFKGQRSLARDFGLEIRWIDVGWGVLGGVVAIFVSAIGGVIWKLISGDDAPSNGEFLPKTPGVLGGILLFILIAVLTPLAEELFFRGLVLRSIGRRWNLTAAVVASSALFGLLHATAGTDLVMGLYFAAVTAIYGAVLALLVVRSGGRLGPSVVAHACINGVAVIALLVT